MIISEETLEAAYVGSLLQSAPAIRQFCATAGILSTDTIIATCLHEFERAHHLPIQRSHLPLQRNIRQHMDFSPTDSDAEETF